jgi:hypothetical protein
LYFGYAVLEVKIWVDFNEVHVIRFFADGAPTALFADKVACLVILGNGSSIYKCEELGD